MKFDRAEALNKLTGLVTPKRLKHSLGVEETAQRMALHYGIDADKAAIAGLLHDCAKRMKPEELQRACQSMGHPPDEIELRSPGILHAPAGAWLAQSGFGIHDGEILQAIARHTVPEWPMTTLDMILSVADLIEPTRDFPGVDELRAIAYDGLEEVFLGSLVCVIRYVLMDGELLHPRSVEVYNQLLLKRDMNISQGNPMDF